MLSKLCKSILCFAALFVAGSTVAATCADLGRLSIDTVLISETENREAGNLSQNPRR